MCELLFCFCKLEEKFLRLKKNDQLHPSVQNLEKAGLNATQNQVLHKVLKYSLRIGLTTKKKVSY